MLLAHLNRQRLEREAAGLKRQRRTSHSPCGTRVRVSAPGGPDSAEARELLAFCSNDYLGLAAHPALADALAEGARQHGSGSGASHLVSGHHAAHAALEATLAQWFAPHIPGAQALTFCTGYLANLALLTALGDAQTTLLADKLNHASLVDGALLSKATLQRYAHGQLGVLARQLQACTTPLKLIVSDTVFSMDGDLADVPALLALAEAHDAWLVLDDAHGFGVLGPQGQGALAHFGLRSERLIVMGTLGKAAGVGGAFVAAHPEVITALVQTARPYIYTTATPPALAHAVSASLALIAGPEGAARRAHLQVLIAALRTGLQTLIAEHPGCGWRLAESASAIQALIVGDNAAALALSAALEATGIWVPAIRPPTVPVGTARLRFTLSASHTLADVAQLLAVLAQHLSHPEVPA